MHSNRRGRGSRLVDAARNIEMPWKDFQPYVNKLLERGWRQRNSLLGEFYYQSPDGTKLHSRNEVVDFVKGLENEEKNDARITPPEPVIPPPPTPPSTPPSLQPDFSKIWPELVKEKWYSSCACVASRERQVLLCAQPVQHKSDAFRSCLGRHYKVQVLRCALEFA